MGKISTYSVLSTPSVTDKLIGTDVTTNNETKNFLIGDLLSLVIGGNIGKQLGGGIVVSEWDENGVHKALIASLTNLASLPWTISPYDVALIGAAAQSFSDGSTNTDAIIAQTLLPADTTYAAGIARGHAGGGFTDWYLPSLWELNMLYNSATIVNRVLGPTNGFLTSNKYWSSTEVNNVNAWEMLFLGGGAAGNSGKNYLAIVRAVRIHNI